MRAARQLFLWLLFFAALTSSVYFIPKLLANWLGTETPTLTVISRSMWPALNRGDMIIVQKVAREELRVGMVLVFRHGQGLAVHRIVRLDKDTFTTKGDANPEEDDPQTYDAIVGQVPIFMGQLVRLPVVGRLALVLGPKVEVSQEGVPAPVPSGFMAQLGGYVRNPLALLMLILLPTLLFLSSLIGDVRSVRGGGSKRWRQRRAQQLRKRWAKVRV